MIGSELKVYEEIVPCWPTGIPMRPGGLSLTERALSFCSFSPGDRLLDVGCGTGVTLEYLIDRHSHEATGIDPSPILLEHGARRKKTLPMIQAAGEELPFQTGTCDGVLLECSLSVSHDAGQVLRECKRVLKYDGKLILSDIFLTGPHGISCKIGSFLATCLAGAMPKQKILENLWSHAFEVMLWEDHSPTLAPFLAQLILSGDFPRPGRTRSDGCDSSHSKGGYPSFYPVGRAVGYFMLVARKNRLPG